MPDAFATEKTKSLLERLDHAVAGSNRSAFYPVAAKSGKGSRIFDFDGNSFVDFNASWTTAPLGYSNEEIINSIEEEMKTGVGLIGMSNNPNEKALLYAEKLIKITPGSHEKKVWFGADATQACSATYKLFPLVTKRERMITFFGAMHGYDLAAIAMGGMPSTAKFRNSSLVTKVPYAYCYRCPFGLEYPNCGEYCAYFIEEQVFKFVNPPEDTSHLLIEPIQGDGGDVVPPPGYLEKLKKICDKYGILFTLDEAKTGIGRTGKMFAIEHSDGVVPDAVALGKGVGGGIPIGPLIARKELLDTAFLATSFSGSAIGSAAGLTLLNIIERERIVEHAGKIGDYMLGRLNDMKAKHRLIGDVRGKGLVIGVELVTDQKKKTAARAEAAATLKEAWKLGVLLTVVGPEHNVIEMTPPLNISQEDVDIGLDCFDRALSIVESAR